jgi:hypothetical protein
MTATSSTVEPDDDSTMKTTSAAAPAGSDPADRPRVSSRRKAAVVTSLLALVAVVALVGIVFPAMLGAAVAIAVAAAIVVLELILPPREGHQLPESYWIP